MLASRGSRPLAPLAAALTLLLSVRAHAAAAPDIPFEKYQLANGLEVSRGRIVREALPSRLVERFQVIEYLSAFVLNRLITDGQIGRNMGLVEHRPNKGRQHNNCPTAADHGEAWQQMCGTSAQGGESEKREEYRDQHREERVLPIGKREAEKEKGGREPITPPWRSSRSPH